MRTDTNIPHKANRILNLILLAFLLILIRVWYLGCVQQEYHYQQARKPKRKTVLQKVERATIRDRFNVLLAHNKVSYNLSVRYADLREIPAYRWIKDDQGKKIKEAVRGPYISSLAQMLGSELSIDPQVIEDIIYAKASLFPHTSFLVKGGLSEKEYYRMRMLQKDWRGIEAERVSRRVYPLQKTACDVVGYMGAINPKEYLQIAEETKTLQEYIKNREMGEIVFLPPGYDNPIDVRRRLKTLQEKAYTASDQIGKAGIEGFCDEMLRGVHGKVFYEMDPKGNILRQLPGTKKEISGQKVFLAISAELQEYAEQLLAQHEVFRDAKDRNGKPIPGTPWIKGAAAIAMSPKTGEIYALASYPRFDPNDFIPAESPELKKTKQAALGRWLESESYIGDIWNGKTPLTRELYLQNEKKWIEEKQELTWKYFLSTILPPGSSLEKAMEEIDTVRNAYVLLKSVEQLMDLSGAEDPAALLQAIFHSKEGHLPGKKEFSSEQLSCIYDSLSSFPEKVVPCVQELQKFLAAVRHNDDKLLILDLIRLLVCTDTWKTPLIERIGHLSLSRFLELSQAFKKVQDEVKEQVEKLHHEIGFKEWRKNHFKEFLKNKRKEEKANKRPAKPYTEYLEKIERTLFKQFWEACKYLLLDAAISQDLRIPIEEHVQLQPYLDSLASFSLPSSKILQPILTALSPSEAIEWMKCMRSFDELKRPLYGKYRLLRNAKGVQLEKHLAAGFYPNLGFGYVRSQAFRQSTPQGSVFKIAVAYEALKERYLYLKDNLLSLKDLNPLTVIDQIQMNAPLGSLKQQLGYTLDGQPIHRLYKGGILPRTKSNIGKIDILGAIERSSNIYFALLAAEHVADPSCLERATRELGLGERTGIELPGEIKGSLPEDLSENKTNLYSYAMGQHSLIVTPLQTAVMYAAFANGGQVLKPQILSLISGKEKEENVFGEKNADTYLFQESLNLVGIDFPLFTEAVLPAYSPLVRKVETEVKGTVFLPEEIRTILMQGMQQVVTGSRGTARASVIRYLKLFPEANRAYDQIKGALVGKTGTAEFFHKQWLDSETKAEIRNHIWFAGIVFPEQKASLAERWEEGELVVIVYLRYSLAGGKEAAPIGAQIAAKWREIQKRRGGASSLESISLEEICE